MIQVSSEAYHHWLTPWAESVAALDRRPDLVVIASPSRPPSLAVPFVWVEVAEPFSYGGWLNTAVASCPTDWIVWIGADDTFRPHALNLLDDCPADILSFGMDCGPVGIWIEEPVPSIIASGERNCVPVGSPFRRWIWESLPFQPHLAPFEDWAFWTGAARMGATFLHTRTVDVDYRWHADTPTEPEPTGSRIRAWATSLGSSSRPPDATA